jgi:hypothetical protein
MRWVVPVRVDRFEDGDAPSRAPEGNSGTRPRAELTVLTEPERRLDESRSNRALIEQAYGTAGTWAQAPAELRAIWARRMEVLDRIEATQAPRDVGSVLPKSFNLTTASGDRVWVAPNATKHMWEETRGLTYCRAISQEKRLIGLADAVDNATIGNWEQLQVSRGWQLIFSEPRSAGKNPALKHARYVGGGGL